MAPPRSKENPLVATARADEDRKLVERAVAGEQMAFARLMNRYRDAIYFLLLKMVHDPDDADDLTIETFTKAFSNLTKYTPDYAFSTWLYRIALNHGIDFIRRRRMEVVSIHQNPNAQHGDREEMELPAGQPDPEQGYVKKQRNAMMKEAVKKMSPKYRLLIELRYFEELSYKEIAERMQLPLGTVKAQLFRARNLLQQVLKSGWTQF